MARLSTRLYRAARIANTAGALASGKPKRAGRRVRNLAVGRTLARGGFWNWLFGGKR